MILAPALSAQPADPGFAVGDRVADGDGLKGVIVKIGGAGDPYYYSGCYAIHFDYEASDPTRVQWTCTANGSKLFKLAAGNVPIAQGAPLMANPAPPAALQATPLPARQPLAAQPGLAPRLAAPLMANPAPPAAFQATPLPARQPLAAQPGLVPRLAAPPDQPGQGSIAVQGGNYECYGAVGTLGGFNFTVAGPGAYTDVEGKPGTYTMAGGMMTFHGGAHDGERATFFPGPDASHPSHITFENTLGGGLGISCDKVS